jgi:hypothetical protein
MLAVTRRAVVPLLCGVGGVLAWSAPSLAGGLLLAGPLESPAVPVVDSVVWCKLL